MTGWVSCGMRIDGWLGCTMSGFKRIESVAASILGVHEVFRDSCRVFLNQIHSFAETKLVY